jgi:hypothetical protein
MPMPPPPSAAVPVAVPVANANRTAWQTPQRAAMPMQMQAMPNMPMQQQQQQTRVYCNPHPKAPPIPAQQLESRYMKSRDINYVIHSILRPVLTAGMSESDYDIQFLQRRGADAAAAQTPKQKENAAKEQRDKLKAGGGESKWSSENAVLGRVAKTNVARPRALLATGTVPVTADDDAAGGGGANVENKQRASLWKARIYCDQAYQAYQAVVESWRSATPGHVPPSVQPHLIKLMKCLGITKTADVADYQVDSSLALQLLLKLDKGRVLLSRVLEQALLPPNAVQTLLPVILNVLYTATKKGADDPVDDRLFDAITGVIQTLPGLSGTIALLSVKTIQQHSGTALVSTSRMQCVHSLLQRGGDVAAKSGDANLQQEWNRTETEFMNVLAGM